ncbi:MAG: hypothetical protein OEM62_12455, partial [Acidobacteriota bacterium]|nr:hypothetical protein [Acidobacteriota bacterium]
MTARPRHSGSGHGGRTQLGFLGRDLDTEPDLLPDDDPLDACGFEVDDGRAGRTDLEPPDGGV